MERGHDEKALIANVAATADEIIRRDYGTPLGSVIQWTPEEREIIVRGLSEEHAVTFMRVCRIAGLDPLARQIYPMVYRTKEGPRLIIHTGIDGFRSIAQRTGFYRGQVPVTFRVKCRSTGESVTVPHSEYDPDSHLVISATVGILHTQFSEPLYATALKKSYYRDTETWKQYPDLMLAKCAEALAIRKAFPQSHGMYLPDEVAAVDADYIEVTQQPPKPTKHLDTTEDTIATLRQRFDRGCAALKLTADMEEGGLSLYEQAAALLFEAVGIDGWDDETLDADTMAKIDEWLKKSLARVGKQLVTGVGDGKHR